MEFQIEIAFDFADRSHFVFFLHRNEFFLSEKLKMIKNQLHLIQGKINQKT